MAQVPLLIKRRHVWSPRSYRYTLKLYTLVSPAGVIRGQPTAVATRDVSLACMCTRACNTRVYIDVQGTRIQPGDTANYPATPANERPRAEEASWQGDSMDTPFCSELSETDEPDFPLGTVARGSRVA